MGGTYLLCHLLEDVDFDGSVNFAEEGEGHPQGGKPGRIEREDGADTEEREGGREGGRL
jgi:hypothetical protein